MKLERDLKSCIIWDYSRTEFHTDFSVTTATASGTMTKAQPDHD
jgi:hypothetical protein